MSPLLLVSELALASRASGWWQGAHRKYNPRPPGIAKEAFPPGGPLLHALALCRVPSPRGIQGPGERTPSEESSVIFHSTTLSACFHVLGNFPRSLWVSFS